MPPRKDRIAVVFDTNVIVRRFLSRTQRSASAKVYHLWSAERRLQLVVSLPVMAEYLEILARIDIHPTRLARFEDRLRLSPTVTRVNLGKRFTMSRDVDDDVLLATAHAGRARYLVTNDRDLLEIAEAERRALRFEIVTPSGLLRALML